jgi:hypothetical protein
VKKSFLLVGVILDIVIISLIIVTALNIVNITQKVNKLTNEKQKFDELYIEIQKIIYNIHSYADFSDVKDYNYIDKVLDKNYTYNISITPMVYLFEDNGSFYHLENFKYGLPNKPLADFLEIKTEILKKDTKLPIMTIKKVIKN